MNGKYFLTLVLVLSSVVASAQDFVDCRVSSVLISSGSTYVKASITCSGSSKKISLTSDNQTIKSALITAKSTNSLINLSGTENFGVEDSYLISGLEL